MTYVWPRLPEATAVTIYDRLDGVPVETLRETASLDHHDAASVAVGGTPVPPDRVRRLQTALRDLADDLGFPKSLARHSVSRFDRPATRLLHDIMEIVPADAASAEVWHFVSLVVLPDVAVWRFPDRARPRMTGHHRNAFRRLWVRAETVGPDLVDSDGGLGEDEFVNIMERTSIAADRRLSRLLASEIIRAGETFDGSRSELMRDAAKRVLRLQASLCLEVLDDAEIELHVSDAVRHSAAALSENFPENGSAEERPQKRPTTASKPTTTGSEPPPRRRRKRPLEGRQRQFVGISLTDLLAAHLIQPGEAIEWNRPQVGEHHRATVDADGTITTDTGARFTSLSLAADTLSGGSFNGWDVWRVTRLGGVRLGELRAQLRED